MTDLHARLASVPDATVERTREVAQAIEDSVRYLGSATAETSIYRDPYWPKWDSPWWHMLVLHELGETARIPARAVEAMVDTLRRLPIQVFPIHPEDVPPGAHRLRDSACHCSLGSIAQILASYGIDVDTAVPWWKPWFTRYQLADGGFTCDGDAYLVTDECPSSMVGTVALFEALLMRRWTAGERTVVERAAGFLIERQLRFGSSSRTNAEERDAAPAWLSPTFPRLYFYDVLRGLAALARWAELVGAAPPLAAITPVVEHLVARYPDGVVRVERRAYDGKTTYVPGGDEMREPTSGFALLAATGVIGAPSEALTRQWASTRRALLRLL